MTYELVGFEPGCARLYGWGYTRAKWPIRAKSTRCELTLFLLRGNRDEWVLNNRCERDTQHLRCRHTARPAARFEY
jgi:hypothetical protein